jgi:NitT/TauT family transport system substrate-binding protein
MKVFQEGYNEACDSINKYGVRNYRDVIRKYCVVTEQTLKNLPDTLKFQHAAPPRQIDIERAQKWLSKK